MKKTKSHGTEGFEINQRLFQNIKRQIKKPYVILMIAFLVFLLGFQNGINYNTSRCNEFVKINYGQKPTNTNLSLDEWTQKTNNILEALKK